MNALVIDTGANGIVNSGTLAATGLGGLSILSDVSNSGLIWANGGGISFTGAVTGDGEAQISGHGIIEFGGASSEHVHFDAAAAGTLVLDAPAAFTGTIAGMTDDDLIDFRRITF